MRFGSVPVEAAAGAILAHALALDGGRIAKGTRLTEADVARIRAAGIAEVVVAVLGEGDLAEDEAAEALGEALGSDHVRVGPAGTGRVNFFAKTNGVFVPDKTVVDCLNAIDPAITLATLKAFEPVEAGRMVATVKIIPLAVAGASVAAARALLHRPAFRLASYRPARVALIQTELPGVKASVLDKTRGVLEARLGASGSSLASETRCPHATEALAVAIDAARGADLTIVFGASAVIDARDVVPAAVEAAGGRVVHLGMPVDPGNLLLLGELDGKPILGAPGCARSPKENGFDWVLNRLLANLPVTSEDIRGMGVGGLLMEIASRPQPRERVARAQEAPPVVDALLLAAGRSSRMGGPNKLLATFDGVPLVRRSAVAALGSRARRVRVVVGYMRERVAAALAGLDVEIVENPAFAEGLSTSLIAGFEACAAPGPPAAGVLVMLADQPLVTSADLDALIADFAPDGPGAIVAATDQGVRANPVVLSMRFLGDVQRLSGDVGARRILSEHEDVLREVEIGAAAGVDVDTPEAMLAAGGIASA